ncbi:MAG: hypothetical protein M3389_03125 [Actinomycetota bacterium]|nr:hypothetical protein [Actinomycetota bacterium]
MSEEHVLVYRPARTVVRLDGTRTEAKSASGDVAVERNVDVTIGVEADPNVLWSLALGESFATDRKFDVTLTPDGRIDALDHQVTGAGAQVVKTIATVASYAARLAATVAGFEAAPGSAVTPESLYALDHPAEAAGRETLRRAIGDLHGALEKLGGELATAGAVNGLQEKQKTIEAALATARAELAVLDAHFETWRAQTFVPQTTSASYAVATDALPRLDRAAPLELDPPEDLVGMAGPASTLGVVVFAVKGVDSKNGEPDDRSTILYRVPRRVDLAVYKQSDEGDERWKLHRTLTTWALDSWCEVSALPLRAAAFGKHNANADFGDTGALVKLTNADTGAAADVATALGDLGKTVSGTLDEAAKIGKHFETEDPALAKLKAELERKKVEADIAAKVKEIAAAKPPAAPSPSAPEAS